MHRLSRFSLAIILCSASVVAFAQEMGSTINKQDLPDPRSSIDQSPVTTGEVPLGIPVPATGKVRISNANSVATDSSTSSRIGTGKEGQPLSMIDTARREQRDSEFQKFVQESIGKRLPIFGSELFKNTPSTFAPILNSPIPPEYPLGPGDEILVRGWGSIDIDYRATVDRNGLIAIPVIGSIVLGGVPAGQVESVIQGAVGRLYKGVNLSVTFGHMRAITVYVVGQASRPGTYTVSNVSTLVNALFASGGPNANGSMRRIQVKRAGKVAAELDLYEFISKGDKHADIKLQDGDTIYIPPALGFVAMAGEVNIPAIFELRTANDTVENLIEFGGGLPVLADPRRVFLERIDPTKSQPRTVEEFALDADGLKKSLKNGDLLNIVAITPDFSNAVVLRGHVNQAIRAPFKQGMRISDLIPSRDYLISRASVRRQNNTLNEWQARELAESRAQKRDEKRDAKGDVPRDENADENEDDNWDQKRDAKAPGNRIEDRGEVEGGFDAADNKSGSRGREKGSAILSTSIASRIGNLIDEINWDYAVIERINRSDLSVSLIPFNLGDVFENPAGPNNVALQPGDTVTIFSQQDVLVPLEKRKIFVRVEGEVNIPGVYQMNQGDNLHMLIARAGGPTRNAYLFGTGFYREQVRKDQEANLEKATSRLESRMQNEQAKTTANASSSVDAQTAENQRQAALAAAKETIARMRRLRPTGRISFGLDPTDRSFNKLPELKLENGDRLVIPSRPDFVHVFGSVNSESSLLWKPEELARAYLAKAGVSSEADIDSIFIIRADGSVVAHDVGSWFSNNIDSVSMMPGDSIVVPEKLDKQTSYTRFMVGLKDWTQVIANFGIGAAAIKVLK